MNDDQTPEPPLERVVEEADKLVASGRLTSEEADRLKAAPDATGAEGVLRGIRARHAGERLDVAVAEGEMTREEADEILGRVRGGEHSRKLRSHLAQFRPRRRRKGKTTPPQSGARLGRGAASVSDPVVTVVDLTKIYGEVTAIDGVSFALLPGTLTGFLGPNGAGKSTTLRLMLGLAAPTAGQALISGRRYRELEQPNRLVGAVLESNDFHPGRSGRDHLRVLAAATSIDQSRVEELLELVGLASAAHRAVKTYSLGMRQRLGLAAALLGDPKLLVLDEPASGLDPAGVQWLRRVMRNFADAGGTVLVSSHLLAEIAQSVDRVLIVSHGRVIADAPLDELAKSDQTLEDAYLQLTAESVA